MRGGGGWLSFTWPDLDPLFFSKTFTLLRRGGVSLYVEHQGRGQDLETGAQNCQIEKEIIYMFEKVHFKKLNLGVQMTPRCPAG